MLMMMMPEARKQGVTLLDAGLRLTDDAEPELEPEREAENTGAETFHGICIGIGTEHGS